MKNRFIPRHLPAFSLSLAALLFGTIPTTARSATSSNDCVVKQFVSARNVLQLEPQQVSDKFRPEDERIFAFARLDCTRVASNEVYWFRWLKDGKETTRTKARLDVGRNWRIWSQAKISAGDWSVLLVDDAGRIQVETKFRVAADE